MLVYVLGMDGDPLDPTHPAKARILLKNILQFMVHPKGCTFSCKCFIKNIQLIAIDVKKG